MEDNTFKAGYIDKFGMEAVEANYEEAWDFYKEKALVKLESGKYEIINTEGKTLTTLEKPVIANIRESEFLAFVENDLTGIMDREGNTIVEPRFTSIIEMIDDHIVIKEKIDDVELTGVIDYNGKSVIEPKYENINALGKGYFAVQDKKSNKFALANSKDELLSDFIYLDMGNHLGKLTNDIVSVYDGEETYAIDLNGKKSTVVPELLGKGNISFDGKVTKATINNKVSYYDKSGKIIWEQINIYKLSETAKVIEKTYVGEGLNIRYPMIEGLKDKVVEDIINNKLYKELVDDIITNKSNYKSYNTIYNVNNTNDLLIIDTVTEYIDDEDFTKKKGRIYNISLNKGTFYKLKDLFKDDSNYISILSEMILGQIEQNISAGIDMYNMPEYKGISDNQDFIPQAKNLDIYFVPNEKSSFINEFTKFTISQADIDEMLDLNSEFWWTYLVKKGF